MKLSTAIEALQMTINTSINISILNGMLYNNKKEQTAAACKHVHDSLNPTLPKGGKTQKNRYVQNWEKQNYSIQKCLVAGEG